MFDLWGGGEELAFSPRKSETERTYLILNWKVDAPVQHYRISTWVIDQVFSLGPVSRGRRGFSGDCEVLRDKKGETWCGEPPRASKAIDW